MTSTRSSSRSTSRSPQRRSLRRPSSFSRRATRTRSLRSYTSRTGRRSLSCLRCGGACPRPSHNLATLRLPRPLTCPQAFEDHPETAPLPVLKLIVDTVTKSKSCPLDHVGAILRKTLALLYGRQDLDVCAVLSCLLACSPRLRI